jgi:deazaflavin-dependent oxidoreductase (nitroreductase family)
VIAEFRANEGRCGGRFEGHPMLLLTTTGARSGQARTAPARLHDGRRQLRGHRLQGGRRPPPQLVPQPGERFAATAEVAAEPERARLFDARVRVMPRFGGYRERTSREIPVVVLTPRR